MGTITVTNSVTLHPTGYTGLTGMTIDSSYPIANGYYDSSHTSYTRFNVNTSTTGYVYFTFDTSDIPSNATITSITGNFKARVSSTSRITNTVAQLYANTTAKGSNVTFASTSASVRSLTPGSASTWTAANIANLRLRIGGTASSSNSSRRIDFYGADVTIEYSYTVTTYDITINNSSSAIVTASNNSPAAGESVEITASTLNGINVTDNGTNVNSQFVLVSTGSDTGHPTNYTSNNNFTLTSIDNAYHDSDNTTYAQLQLAGSTTGSIYFTFPSFTLPTGATLQSVSCSATLQFNANGSSSGFTSSFQMYANTTAKGSSTQWVSSGSNVAKTTYNVTMGSWSASDLSNPRFYITATNSARSTVRYIYIYGATMTVTYQMSSGGVYVYTISNISGNHTIVVTGNAAPVSVTGVSVSPSTSSLEVGNTLQLTASVTPSNATNQTVTWSSSNTSLATVNSSGFVTTIGVGSVRITATTEDGGYTDYCDITITAVVLKDYKITNSLIPGKKYLIVNGNSGSVYMMSNESGGSRTLSGIAATVNNNKISINTATEAKVAFTCSLYDSNNDITTVLMNNGQYIYSDSSTGLRMYTSASMNRFWHYDSSNHKFWLFKSTTTNGYTDTSSEYKYYLEWNSSGDFTDNHLTSPSIEDTTIPAIYLFVEDDGSATEEIYIKTSGTWTQYSQIYLKINGSWVEQNPSTWSTLFDSSTNYKLIT